MVLPNEILKQGEWINGDPHKRMPEYFRELKDPDIEELYIPSDRPCYNDIAKFTYWPILHLYKSKRTGKYFRIIGLGHGNQYDPLRNMLIEINYELSSKYYSDIKSAMIETIQCKINYIKNPWIESELGFDPDKILNLPLMVTTFDGAFEMYTVGIRNQNTWPIPIILDKWFYKIKTNDRGFGYVIDDVYFTTIWAFNTDRLKVHDPEYINRKPLNRNKNNYSSIFRNESIPWQFCSLDDAEQFAFSLEYLMETRHAHTHTELLHRLMTYPNTGRCRYLYPVGHHCMANVDRELGIDYDEATERWILKPQIKAK